METDGYNKGFYNAYQQSSDTVNQVEQVVMLYDGAINFIRQAKEAINEKNYEKRYNLINKAIAIVTGLNPCLEFNDATQETAKALDDFYSMIDMRLLYIQCDDSVESCDKVIEDLRVMREAWAEVAKKTIEASAALEQVHEDKSFVSDDVEIAIQSGDNEGSQTELHITA